MESIEKPINDKIFDVKRILKGLFFAYPNLKYIAINPSITIFNEFQWTNDWYMVGFEKKPVLSYVDNYLKWVISEEITSGDDEMGLFFLHFSSYGYFIDDQLIQSTETEFMNPIDLCFTIDSDKNIVNYKPEKLPKIDEEEFN